MGFSICAKCILQLAELFLNSERVSIQIYPFFKTLHSHLATFAFEIFYCDRLLGIYMYFLDFRLAKESLKTE